MKIILLGADGQVGWQLQRSLNPNNELKICGRQYDFKNIDFLVKTIRNYKPDIIVNAAAYTAVDKAEEDQHHAYLINTKTVEILANEAKDHNSWFIHYSTDYVYDGQKESSYDEDDDTNPLNIYGASKLAGEKAVQTSGCLYLIFRTSWVFSARRNNFFKSIIRLAKERETINVISDQFGVPTSAEFIADVTAMCVFNIFNNNSIWEKLKGVYNLVPLGETTWHNYSKFIVQEARQQGLKLLLRPENIIPVVSEQYPLPAKRPKNSRLNNSKIQKEFNISINVNWQFYVKRLIEEIIHFQV